MNRQLRSFMLIALLVSLSLPVGGAASHSPAALSSTASNKNMTAKQSALHDAMRKLWEDHITWTRLFVISAVKRADGTSVFPALRNNFICLQQTGDWCN